MYKPSPVSALAQSLYHAINIGFSNISYEINDSKAILELSKEEQENCKKNKTYPQKIVETRPGEENCEVIGMFLQLWGSTALGFGGIGGAAMTYAYTVVIECSETQEALVYWNGRLAYKVKKETEGYGHLLEDIKNKQTLSKSKAVKKYEVDLES